MPHPPVDPSPAGGGIVAAVEVHTPCGRDDIPLPPPCPYRHVAETSIGHLRGRCRGTVVGLGEHLLFGSQQPDRDRRWLQVGPYGPFPEPAGRLVSGVAGQLWVTGESGGGRVMVENLSASMKIEIRSSRLPYPVVLHPVDPDEPLRDRWLGTPIAALQTPTATLALVNEGQEFPVWATVTTNRWSVAFSPRDTVDVRDHGDVDVDEAAMRVQLGSPDHLDVLRAFVDHPAVRRRLRTSPTLRAFLDNPRANRTGTGDPDSFCRRQLERVAAGRATHELHRLILEGLGRPPRHASKHYTDAVRELLEPHRERASIRGGAGGLSELVGPVRAVFRFRPERLAAYLGIDVPTASRPGRPPG